MKAELEVIRLETSDIVTVSGDDSGCANPAMPAPLGNKLCDGDLG